MTTVTTPSSHAPVPSLEAAWQDVNSSFERFCLTAGLEQPRSDDFAVLVDDPRRQPDFGSRF